MNIYDPAVLQKKPKKKRTRRKGLVVFLCATVILLGIGIVSNTKFNNLSRSGNVFTFGDSYIAVLEVHGTMSDDGSDPAYNQEWLLSQIENMMEDDYNKGLLLSIDTPGGSVYTVDELYLKIKEYQEVTRRPVYAYMESMAASGGYYISAPANQIFANRNCWTGSIGVTIGTIYDITDFLETLGISAVTITAGDNKAMGSAVEPLSKEQKAIFQSLVDDAYRQFVDVVAEGRSMKWDTAAKLADGRIYTAKQGQANGLIDAVGTVDEALEHMRTHYKLEDCYAEYFIYEPEFSFGSWLYSIGEVMQKDASSQYEDLMKLMAEDNKFTITYMSQVRK